MNIQELLKQPEGRRLEFKQKLPGVAELARTIVSFANDAGGCIYLGIRNKPREICGIPEDELMLMEEQISNIIYEQCYPVILPEISFLAGNGMRFIKVNINRGSNLPYYVKSKGKSDGTYVRVGSSNRKADAEIIGELERQKRNVSFDSELVYDVPLIDINIEPFKAFYKEKTGEDQDQATLRKLELVKEYQGVELPTNAYILFSDSQIKKEIFPYAKIECARFKGLTSEEFIDQKTIEGNIAAQAESAYDFVLRHINKSAKVRGVYTESRWEFPVKAIREAIRNAVVHRDYSFLGQDIKIAIYDDMVEITNPGKLKPSIDFSEMEARQSDIRNKIIAPGFKKLGVIDQWGNGLKLISDELKLYPEIEFRWFERGLQFQVQFVKKDKELINPPQSEVEETWNHGYLKQALSWHQVGTKLALSLEKGVELMNFCEKPKMIQELMAMMGWKDRTKFRNKYLNPLISEGVISMLIPLKPTSSKQMYYLTDKGKQILLSLQRGKGEDFTLSDYRVSAPRKSYSTDVEQH